MNEQKASNKGRPKKPHQDLRVVSVWLPKELVERADIVRAKTGTTRTQLMLEGLEWRLKEAEKGSANGHTHSVE